MENRESGTPESDSAGDMTALVLAFDWATTPLGPLSGWPQSLRTAVQLILDTPFPNIVLWGPTLTQIYNNGYRDLMGAKHPAGLGQATRECWPEVWHINEPIYERVFQGESLSFEDTLYPLARAGQTEEVWLTLSYSPIREEAGNVGGVLVTVFETTERIRAEKALQSSELRQRFLLGLNDRLRTLTNATEILYEAARTLGEHLQASRVGYAEDLGDDEHVAVTRNYTRGVPGIEGVYQYADYGATLVAAMRAGETLVYPDIAADPALSPAEKEAHAILQLGATVNVPLIKGGRLVAILFVHQANSRAWTADEVTLMMETAERTWDAVERARAEAALQASEEKYRTLFNSMDEGVVTLELLFEENDVPTDFRYLEHNPALTRQTGFTGTLVNRRGSEVFPNREAYWLQSYARVASTGKSERHENYFAPLDSWFDIFVSRVGGPGSRTVVTVYNNITERKRAEEALRQSEERHAFLLTLSDAVRSLGDPMEIQATTAQTAREFFGADRCYYCELINGQAVVQRDSSREGMASVAGVYPLRSSPLLRAVLHGGRSFVIDNAHTTDLLDASLRQQCIDLGILSCINVPVIKDGRSIGVLCLTQEQPRAWSAKEIELATEVAERTWAAVERAKAETALRESEARIRTLSDAVPQVIWANDAVGRASYFNRRWYEYTGLSYEESVGPGWQAVVHPDDAAASREKWEKAQAVGEVFDTEYRLRGGNGLYRWFIGRNVPLKDPTGKVVGWFGSATDIEELKESEARFRLLVEGAKDYAMFLMSTEGKITFWGAGAERIFGWTELEALGKDAAFIFTPEDRATGMPEHEQKTALINGRASDRRWHLRKDGSRFWADGLLMRLDGELGSLHGFAKVTRDATEQKQAEDAIQAALETLERRVQQRTQELSSANTVRKELLHRLVNAQEEERGNIARELHDNTGQLVTALSLGLDNLSDILPAPLLPEALTLLSQMRHLVEELSGEARRLSASLRPTALDQFGLEKALKNYLEQWVTWSGLPLDYQPVGFGGVSSEVRLPREVESAAYRVVQEALTNILRHAKTATQVSVLLQRTPTHLIAVVEDNGPGFQVGVAMSLPPDRRRLGLFSMKERAELIGGTLDIESRPGAGTSIVFRAPLQLPATQEAD